MKRKTESRMFFKHFFFNRYNLHMHLIKIKCNQLKFDSNKTYVSIT